MDAMTDDTRTTADAFAWLPRDEAPATVREAVAIRDAIAQELRGRPDRVIERDWRSEVIYFLLPDRFNAAERPDLELHEELPAPDAALPDGDRTDLRWDLWAISGRNRFQGGTIAGITEKIQDGYLPRLGITALWVGPVWKQRVVGVDRNVGRLDGRDGQPQDDLFPDPPPLGLRAGSPDERLETARALLTPYDDYHGYAIQDFLQVDPRFGDVDDLRSLVRTAHAHGIRVILDVMINHTGENWIYDSAPLDTLRPPYLGDEDGARSRAVGARYGFGRFLDATNAPMCATPAPGQRDCGVWPAELQDEEVYHRRGFGSYSGIEDFKDSTQFREADWMNRDLAYPRPREDPPEDTSLVDLMTDVWTYWMVVTDCDGFRVDTFKHVPMETAARFTSAIRTYAADIGKADFLVAGEVGGPDADSSVYLHLEDRVRRPYPHLRVRLLEVDERRKQLRWIAGADPEAPTVEYVLAPTLAAALPPQYLSRLRDDVVTSIDDHDGLGVGPRRFAAAYGVDAVVPALGLLLFGPGIPCLYYGTEQALSGPEETTWLGGYGYGDGRAGGDRYLREAMFAPRHPRRAGAGGLLAGKAGIDPNMPGFTPGRPPGIGYRGHRFDEASGTYLAAQELLNLRKSQPVLQLGEVQPCLVATGHSSFILEPAAPVIAWTRVLTTSSGSRTIALVVVDNQRVGSPPLTRRLRLPSFVHDLELAAEATPFGPTGRRSRLATTSVVSSGFRETTLEINPCTVQVYLEPAG